MSELSPSDLAPGLFLGSDVELGNGVVIGANVVIHSGTVIGDGSVIQDGAVLGKKSSKSAPSGVLKVGDGSFIGSYSLLYTDVEIGAGVRIGDQAFVRERSRIGEATLVGRGSVVENNVEIGSRVSIQTNCYITAFTKVEDDVFVGPGLLTTNDNTMARHGPEHQNVGPTLRRGCRIGGAVVITPEVEIGEEAFVAAGAVVTKDVAAREVVAGVPARQIGEVGEEDLLEQWR